MCFRIFPCIIEQGTVQIATWFGKKSNSDFFFFFFYQGFLSRTLTTHRTAGEGRGLFFLPLYHFHPLTTFRHLCAIQMMTITTFLGGTPTGSWSMPQEPYIIWLSFMIHMCEVIYLLVVFSFFQNFDVLGC